MGVWPTGAYPSAVAFDRTSSYALASNRSTLFVFDVATDTQVMRHSITACSSPRGWQVDFSRGGELGFQLEICGYRDESSRIHWKHLSLD